MSGGTRCNITQATDRRGIVKAFGTQGNFLHSALAGLSPEDLLRVFHQEGVPTKVEPGGKVFPVSNKATDVLQALLRRLERTSCQLALQEPLLSLRRTTSGEFELQTSRRLLHASQVIVTTGGKSYPGSGTTGDGYQWMEHLGHTIVPPRPALTPITTDAQWIRDLQGLTLSDVLLSLYESEPPQSGCQPRHALAQRRESFLFTHFGMSGPAALDISREISGHRTPRSLFLACDFLPGETASALQDRFRRWSAESGKKQLTGLFAELVPRRLAEALLASSGVSVTVRAAEFGKRQRESMVDALKHSMVPVTGTRGYKKAEVTAGGVALAEVDSRTMASRLIPNLFIAGELLDLDGPIGGYNFQAAFSTAWLAGSSI